MSETNPYRINIDLSDADSRKLFHKAIKGIDEPDKFDMIGSGINKFIAEAEEANQNFYWGKPFNQVQLVGRTRNQIITKSLFLDPTELTLEQVTANAQRYWLGENDNHLIVTENDPNIMQERIRASMSGKWIKNSLTKSAKRKLMLKKKLFQFKNADGTIEEDGPLMYKVIYDKCNPSVRAGVMDLKNLLANFKLRDYNYDVPNMLTKMEEIYTQILNKKKSHDDYILNIFNALKTSKDKRFHEYIERIEDSYESGEEMTVEELVELATKKYNNMGKLSSDLDDNNTSKSTNMLTLVSKMIVAYAKNGNQQGAGQNDSGQNKKGWVPIQDWRKTKTDAKVVRNGKTWYWCRHHVKEGDYDGLYVTHKEEDHDSRQVQRKFLRRNQKSQNTQGQDPSMELNNELATMLSKEDMEAAQTLFSQIAKNE